MGGSIYIQNCKIDNKEGFESYECFIIVYVARGSGSFINSGEEVPVLESDIFLIKPQEKFKFIHDDSGRLDLYCCCLYPGLFNKLIKFSKDIFEDILKRKYIKITDSNKKLRELFIIISDEYVQGNDGCVNVIVGYVTVLVTKILRQYKNNDISGNNKCRNRIVDEGITHIHHMIYSAPKPSDVAARCHVTTDHLRKMFKIYTGLTTTEYINKVRMEKVADMLKNTDTPIELIGEKFDCRKEYIRRSFKRYMGISMQEYRKKFYYK